MKKKIIILGLLFFLILSIFYIRDKYNLTSLGINVNNVVDNFRNSDNFSIEKDELFFEYYDEALELMKDMTIEQKVSQVFLANYAVGSSGLDNSYVGGFIFYSPFFRNSTKEEVINEINNLQRNSKIKYAISVDEEGGFVSRISFYNQFRAAGKFMAPMDLYNIGGMELILKTEDEKDALLKELGFNLNFAPVADVSTDSRDYINIRTIGQDAKITADYIYKVTERAKKNNLSTCLKHYPGYGSNGDTHAEVIVDKRKLEVFEQNDFLPFQAGINAGTPYILTSHTVVSDIDDKPVSLSKKAIDLLKEDMNFSGIVVTDDITMLALNDYNQRKEAAIMAFEAGNDMLMTSNYYIHYQELLDAVKSKRISEERLDYSVKKILAWKYAYGII